MKRLRKQMSFANVMSVTAVFIALGGAAYAGTKINGKSIKNGSIPAGKLKANVLTGLDKCPSSAPTNTNGICYSAFRTQGPIGTSRPVIAPEGASPAGSR